MNFWDNNLGALRKTNLLLADAISSYQNEDSDYEVVEDIVSDESRDKNLILTATVNGEKFRFNSSYRPLEEAKTWASQFDWKNSRIVASVFGFGNGYCLRELIKYRKANDIILVLEPSADLFFHVLEQFDIADILSDEHVYITVFPINPALFYECLGRFVHWSNAECQLFCEHPQYAKAFLKSNALFYEILRVNNTRVYTDRNTEMYFGKAMVENTIKNIRYLTNSNSISDLNGRMPSNVPAIIVSAGPSLDLNIDLLAKAKNKALIIATDSAIPALIAHDIVPDFAITIDAEKSLHCFENVKSRLYNLICESQSTHGIIKDHKGRLIYLHSHPYFSELYRKLGREIPSFTIGGSVATTAFSVCEYLGFSRIVLIGQDLAYKGDISHAGGEVHMILGEETGICYLEGYYGDMVKSRHDWKGYLAWFEEAIHKLKGRIEVINATEGGVKIHGAVQMPLIEVITTYCNEQANIEKMMESIEPVWKPEQKSMVCDYLRTGLDELLELDRKSNDMSQFCADIYNQYEKDRIISEQVINNKKRVEQYNKEVNSMSVYTLVDACIRSVTVEQLQDTNKYTEDKEEEFMRFFRNSKEIHAAISDTAKTISALLNDEYIWFTCL